MNRILLFFALCLLMYSCKTQYHHVYNTDIQHLVIDTTRIVDSHYTNQIAVYKQKIDAEMNQLIGSSAKVLSKQQPESTLGNFIADVIHDQAEVYIGMPSDLTVINYGGLRVDYLPAGDWTIGNIFELMPFDNMLVMIEIKGSVLKEFLALIAHKGGWPVSRHLKMTIHDKKVVNAILDNKVIEDDKIYKLVTNDYLVSGGDNCTFFIGSKQYPTGKFIRDVIVDYIRSQTAKNIIIDANIDGRISVLE